MLDQNEKQTMQELISEAAQQKLEQQVEKEIEIKTRIVTAAYDRSAAYTNLIILAGYAGSFTLWSFTRDYLTEKTAISVALLLGISIFVFCFWEVFKMIYTAKSLRQITNVMLQGLSPDAFYKEIKKVEDQARKDNISLYRYWYFILLLAVPTGFGGALLLFYNYVANLANLPYWPS